MIIHSYTLVMNRKLSIPFACLLFVFAFSCKQADDKESAGRIGQATPVNTNSASPGNFVAAAREVTPAVVHIKTTYTGQAQTSNPIEQLFGMPQPDQPIAMGTGSGVTISADGYIATNNHVVENASAIEVIFPDRRSFEAKLVGRDPNTDLALLKVNAKNLPVVRMGNSDNVEIGEWVLAVGYPYSLNTTVTAGIVSAKGRSIGIINRPSGGTQEGVPAGNTGIESFIQTDAAINPGNSGGALVNTNGELIGINAAIASLTGSYAGYAFAIPVNLAKKVLDDIKQFGEVKRGVLGVSFPSPVDEDRYLRSQGINPGEVKGVFITDVQQGGAADAAGLKEGDIVQSINGTPLYSSAEFSERIARQRPGDKVELTYLRNGKENKTTVTLKPEREAQTARAGASSELLDKLGAKFTTLTPAQKERLGLRAGVLVTEVSRGGFFYQLGVPRGTVIVYINSRPINSPSDLEQELLESRNSRVQMLGIAPDGSRVAFTFSLGA